MTEPREGLYEHPAGGRVLVARVDDGYTIVDIDPATGGPLSDPRPLGAEQWKRLKNWIRLRVATLPPVVDEEIENPT